MSQNAAYTFREQLQKQELYYHEFRNWLKSRGNVIAVTDADDEDERRGIDLWATMLRSDPIPIQVKTDFIMHSTGNMAVELISQFTYDRQHSPGWFHELKNTKLLAYICGVSGDLRLYKCFPFWTAVTKQMNRCRVFTCLNGTPDGGEYWHSMGVLVPVGSIAEQEIMKANIYDKSPGKLVY
jgi:hypothetical protein